MGSLKAFLPSLAGLLGTTGDALYTRQRALADLGVLQIVKGRGPGTGTPLNAHGVAGVLIALLCADTLQETDKRVRSICHAIPQKGKYCPMTGATDFQSAIAAILADPDHWKSVSEIVVYRHAKAQILFGRPVESLGSVFEARPALLEKTAIRISARLSASNVRQIGAMLAAAMTV